MYYGNHKISFCGCGLIAVYNALFDLTGKHEIEFPFIIDNFEKNGIVLSGFFGTSPKSIEDFLNLKGFKTISSSKKDDYDKIGENSDALILTKYNDKNNIFNTVHTINITKKNGKYYIHNDGKNCHLIPYNSISDLLLKINNGNAKDIYLTEIIKN